MKTKIAIKSVGIFKNMNIVFYISEKRTMREVCIPVLCHGETIVEVKKGEENIENCDALITADKNIKLGITTADCAPICFADGEKIGIAHVGWRGLCLGLIEKMLQEFDARNLEIFVGPHLNTFEIQKDFCYEIIERKFEKIFFTNENGKIMFRFKNALASLLPPHAKFDTRDTGSDTFLPSHRRNKTNKRLITVVGFPK